jgi:hypothetical protein
MLKKWTAPLDKFSLPWINLVLRITRCAFYSYSFACSHGCLQVVFFTSDNGPYAEAVMI